MTAQRDRYDAIIVGGGFFGTYVAVHLATRGARVLVVEREPELFRRASLINQARIHRGYHYPRSVLTGMRSAANFSRFVGDFRMCVETSMPAYYAVARQHSNVTAAQYRRFCETIGAPLRPAPRAIVRMFNEETIEEVFAVDEYVFDAVRLRAEMERRMAEADVELALETEVQSVVSEGDRVRVTTTDGRELMAQSAFICAYSATNTLLRRSGARAVPLKHELVEMALIEPPPDLAGIGITVMCGPFFSLMPFPSRGLHTLSHVRYTPHYSWSDDQAGSAEPHEVFRRWGRRTHYEEMVRDAARYLPLLRDSRYADSLWEVKTVLPRSESNDSRPILYVQSPDEPNVICLMGAKIDNVYDVCDVYDATHAAVAV